MGRAGVKAEPRTRTLTGLHNAWPAWLDHAHRRLDAAVALDQERAAAGR